MGCVFSDSPFGNADACAIDRSIQRAESRNGRVDCIFHTLFISDIGLNESCVRTDFFCCGLTRFPVDVSDHDLCAMSGEQLCGRCTKPRASTSNQECSFDNIHISDQLSVISYQLSVISLQSSVFSLQSSVFSLQSSVFSLQSSVFSLQFSVFSFQFSVFSFQFLVFSFQFLVFSF